MINKHHISALRALIKQGVTGNFIKTLALDVVVKGLTFVFLPLYIKVMSGEEFGLFTYLYLIITTVAGVIKMGMDTAFSKLYFDLDIKNRKYLIFNTNFIWLSLFALLFLSALITDWDIWAIARVIEAPIDYMNIRYQLWLFILLEGLITTLNVFSVVTEKFRRFQIFNFIKIILTNVITFILLFYFSENRVALRLTSECLIGLLIFLPLVVIVIKNIKITIDKKMIDKSLQIGLPMMGTLIVSTLYLFADRYFIQKYSGLNALAIYNFCIILTMPISLFFTSFNTIWFPKFAREKDLKINFHKTMKIFLILLVVFIFISFAVWFLLFLAFQNNWIQEFYRSSLLIIPVVFISRILDTLSNLYTNFVVILGKTTFNFILVLILSALTLLLNYIFTPSYGNIAAATILTLISSLRIGGLFLFSRYYSLQKINTYNS